MTDLQIIILGIVQGVSEFLPVSSTAHLVLTPYFFDMPDQGLIFDIAIHFGSLLAVMLYFAKEVGMMIKGCFDLLLLRTQTPPAKLVKWLLIATIPAGIAGLLFMQFIADHTRSLMLLGVTSIVFGLLLGVADKAPAVRGAKYMGWPQALVFGLFQALAIIPGVSRSGITMTAGRIMGFDRVFAARFSFLMSIPIIFLACVLSLGESAGQNINWQNHTAEILTGVGVSFVVSWLVIATLLQLLKRMSFMPFVIYRVFLGAVLIYLGS